MLQEKAGENTSLDGAVSDLRSADKVRLEQLVVALGFRSFQGRQLHEWIWKRNLSAFSMAGNLPKLLREQLEASYTLHKAVPMRFAESRDGTVKLLFQLHDGNRIEGVLIPSGQRMTACISSQVGCALGCSFCATGQSGFRRDLSPGEMYDQVWEINDEAIKRHGHRLSNIVLMGMGEPLLNFDAVKDAVAMITSSEGMGMSPSRITISTVGIPEGIRRMADELPAIHLAVSLHTVNDHLRSNLIPVNRKHGLAILREALIRYHEITGNRFSIEYLLLEGVNDSRSAALALAAWCRSFPVKINLIPYNRTGMQFRNSSAAESFKHVLDEKNMVVTIRRSRGQDIDAACGQLADRI